MNRVHVRRWLLRLRDTLMWSPTRAAAAVVSVAAAAVVLAGGSMWWAAREHTSAAATSNASAACVRDAHAWTEALTNTRADDAEWVQAVTARSTGKAAAWLPTMDRTRVPARARNVTPAAASASACVVWVDFTDGHRWYLALVPGTDGMWRVDEWDDGA